MLAKFSSLFALSLLLCLSQAEAAESSGSVYLAPWLVGIIAVAVFLVLVTLFLLFNYYVCDKLYDKEDYVEDEELENVGDSAQQMNGVTDVYETVQDEETPMDRGHDNKAAEYHEVTEL